MGAWVFAFDVSIGDCSGGCAVFWNPHFSTGRGGFQFPVVGIEIHEILMRPLSRECWSRLLRVHW